VVTVLEYVQQTCRVLAAQLQLFLDGMPEIAVDPIAYTTTLNSQREDTDTAVV
jgi:hypothetical protein